jgi:hypothetical protein
MPRARPAALAVLVAAAFAAPLGAAPYTEHFEELIAEVRSRLEEDYGGELDSRQVKEKKGLEWVSDRYEREADAVADDLRFASAADAVLRKAFPGEFASSAGLSVAGPSTLGQLMENTGLLLLGEIEDALAVLEDRLPELSDRGAGRLARILDLAADLMDDPPSGDTRKPFYRGLLRANALILKGHRLADRDPGPAPGAGTFTVTLDGTPYDGAANLSSEYFPSTQSFQVATNFPYEEGTLYVYLRVPGVTGTGTYSLTGEGVQAFLNYVLTDVEFYQFTAGTGGTITYDTYDPANHVAGTFSFDATHGSLGTIAVTAGAFDVTDIFQN